MIKVEVKKDGAVVQIKSLDPQAAMGEALVLLCSIWEKMSDKDLEEALEILDFTVKNMQNADSQEEKEAITRMVATAAAKAFGACYGD